MKNVVKTVLVASAASLVVGCASMAAPYNNQMSQEMTKPKPSVLINVTSDDPQVQLMSMVLTMQSAKQGADTRVLLCGPGGEMAMRVAPASVTTPQPPNNMSAQGLMQAVMKNTNTKVEVCALFLPSKGINQSALIDGVTAANPADIGALMVDENTKIVSF